ncbi:MAG: hypothetical protein JXB47_19795 [Anaerolineae bacterium]|nr:hypothetical protein [Anaerolineae bacterium]
MARQKQRARCPECDAWVNVKDSVELGDIVTCPECETRLEIVGLNPLELDYADDWEDDDYDDDDDY